MLVPAWEPFLKILYPVTATLSEEADHASVTLEDVVRVIERPIGVVGGAVSGVVTETAADSAEVLPAASSADTV